MTSRNQIKMVKKKKLGMDVKEGQGKPKKLGVLENDGEVDYTGRKQVVLGCFFCFFYTVRAFYLIYFYVWICICETLEYFFWCLEVPIKWSLITLWRTLSWKSVPKYPSNVFIPGFFVIRWHLEPNLMVFAANLFRCYSIKVVSCVIDWFTH